jgi:hypothetical protein
MGCTAKYILINHRIKRSIEPLQAQQCTKHSTFRKAGKSIEHFQKYRVCASMPSKPGGHTCDKLSQALQQQRRLDTQLKKKAIEKTSMPTCYLTKMYWI